MKSGSRGPLTLLLSAPLLDLGQSPQFHSLQFEGTMPPTTLHYKDNSACKTVKGISLSLSTHCIERGLCIRANSQPLSQDKGTKKNCGTRLKKCCKLQHTILMYVDKKKSVNKHWSLYFYKTILSKASR